MADLPGGMKRMEIESKGGQRVIALFSRAETGQMPSKKEKAAARAVFEEEGRPTLLLVPAADGQASGSGLLSGQSVAAAYPLWLTDGEFVTHWLQFTGSFPELPGASNAGETLLEKALSTGALEPIDTDELPLEGSSDGAGEASAVSMLVVLDGKGLPTIESMAVAEAAFRATGMPVVLWRDDEAGEEAEEEEEEILTWDDEDESDGDLQSPQERVETGQPPVAVFPAWTADPSIFDLIA
jgi:hypothetical protein